MLGLILVKELILWDHSTRTEVGVLKMRSMPLLRADTRLYDMLRLFETCRCHMALLVRHGSGAEPCSCMLRCFPFWHTFSALSSLAAHAFSTQHCSMSCTAMFGHSWL